MPPRLRLTESKRLAIYMRDQFLCAYCNQAVNAANATIDHIVARQHGGDNDDHNLVTACLSCNSAKQDKALDEFCTQETITGISILTSIPLDRNESLQLVKKHGSAYKYLIGSERLQS